MPITPEDYNNDAIKGEKLERLANLVIQKLVDNGMVSAESLVELEKRLSSVEQHLADTNIGDREADSLDAQSLKVGGNDVAESLSGKADKASSGNGNLAVIDSNGNYVSSGITAYNQSAVNSLVSNLEAYAGRGQYVNTRSVAIETSSGHEGKLFSFTNLRTGITVLDIGIELAGEDLNSLQFYLPISSSEANEWIWETQTRGVPIAVAEVWSTRGMLTMSPTPGNSSVATHSETRIDAYNGTAPDAALISMRHFGSINVGPSGSAYDAFSKVNATLLLRNTATNAFAFVDLSIGVSHYASNNPYPKVWGVATCISDGVE